MSLDSCFGIRSDFWLFSLVTQVLYLSSEWVALTRPFNIYYTYTLHLYNI